MALPVTKNLIMANNKKEISLAEVRGLLLELIAGMSEAESRALLAELQKRRQPKEEPEEKKKTSQEKNLYPRKLFGREMRIHGFYPKYKR